MIAETVSAELAAQLESSEVSAWLDMYAAAPADYARRHELDILRLANVVLTRCRTIPFIHFNCVMNLGMTAPATEDLLDRVLALYDEAGVRSFAFFHIPHSQPASLPQWFEARGLHAKGGWDRIYRGNEPLPDPGPDPGADLRVEEVTQTTAPEWAGYICKLYGLPNEPWLLALAGRPG